LLKVNKTLGSVKQKWKVGRWWKPHLSLFNY
jgi:hypothetical protein